MKVHKHFWQMGSAPALVVYQGNILGKVWGATWIPLLTTQLLLLKARPLNQCHLYEGSTAFFPGNGVFNWPKPLPLHLLRTAILPEKERSKTWWLGCAATGMALPALRGKAKQPHSPHLAADPPIASSSGQKERK